MSRIHRAYLPELPSPGQVLDLQGDTAHHLGRVLRVRPGERVVLFDGHGAGISSEVLEVNKRLVRVEAGAFEPCEPRAAVRIQRAVGLPDRKRAQRLVEALGELGVERLIPLASERAEEGLRSDLLERWALESAKQSGRNTLLQVAEPVTPAELSLSPGVEGWVADPESGAWVAERFAGPPPAELVVAVGPPGGFTPAERDGLVDRGFRALRLGPYVLRVETAAVAAVACAVAAWPGVDGAADA
ncbi:MAG: RsmE family RNA methyltransferase [Planctomycetota bacterium]